MRFNRLDLNLLVALNALLYEKSVSLAADRLCLSQSATSSALSRLREYFDDELLVRKGRSMVLTARGHELIGPVRNVLDEIQNSIVSSPEFNPSESDRSISIMTSDYSTEVLLAEALAELKQIAPNMTFRISSISENVNSIEQLERGVCDMLITLTELRTEKHPCVPLFSDDFVVLCAEDNPHVGDTIDLGTYLRLGHIITEFGNTRMPSFEGLMLKQNQWHRNVEISVGNFLSVPLLVRGTDRIATVHRRLAKRFTSWLPLRTVELPFEMPNISIGAIWHRSAENDPGMIWLVEQLKQIAARKTKPDAKSVELSGEALSEEVVEPFLNYRERVRV